MDGVNSMKINRLLYELICCLVFWALLFIAIGHAEEEFFSPFGFEVFNEEGHRIKFLYDVEHQKLRFRVFESEDVYYEGSIDLIRIWEGEAIE